MNSCNGDVRRIHNCLRRNCTCSCKGLSQPQRISGGVKHRDSFQGTQPLARTERITACGFLENQRRDVEIELRAPRTPPSPGQLLVRALNEIAAPTRREIAHYRRFDVHARRHQPILRPTIA